MVCVDEQNAAERRTPDSALTLDDFSSVQKAFAVRGSEMRVHSGRSVVRVAVDGRTCYLKRYWLSPTQLFQRHVWRGLHELRMIDWLNDHGFAGPQVSARGSSAALFVTTRLFFLMTAADGEMPLEQTWWKMPQRGDGLLEGLASFAARLHDAGFIHTDFSERHIFVHARPDGWTFRLIDLERARVGPTNDRLAASDLKTLASSIADQRLRRRIGGGFLDDYIAKRKTIRKNVDMRALFDRASPTRKF